MPVLDIISFHFFLSFHGLFIDKRHKKCYSDNGGLTPYNPKFLLDECASGWQATEKPVFFPDECAGGWRTTEKSVVNGEM